MELEIQGVVLVFYPLYKLMIMDNRTQNQTDSAAENKNREGGHQNAGNRPATRQHTHIDNAHAAGLGSMGRNDEKLPNAEDGEDCGPEPNY